MGYWNNVQNALKKVQRLGDVPQLYPVVVPDPIARISIPVGLGSAMIAGLWNTLTSDEYDVNPLLASAVGSGLTAGGSIAYRHFVDPSFLEPVTFPKHQSVVEFSKIPKTKTDNIGFTLDDEAKLRQAVKENPDLTLGEALVILQKGVGNRYAEYLASLQNFIKRLRQEYHNS